MSPSFSEDISISKLSGSMEVKPVVAPPPKRSQMLLASFSALLFIVVMGMVASYSSPASVDMLRPGSRFRDITSEQITWIASLPNLAGVLGNAVSGYVSHRFGRKAVLMLTSTLYILSWLAIAYAPSLPYVYAGRLVTGFSAGLCAVAVPAYIVEISTVEIRGFLSAGFQVAFALGVFLVMALGIVLRWSWLAVAGASIVATGACLLLFMPESPSWLARNSRNAEALRGLRFLRGKRHDSVGELKDLLQQMSEEPSSGFTWRELLEPGLYKPISLAVALMFFQQFSGINALMSYAVELFEETKISLDPFVAATIVALVQLLGTSLSSILMDRAGRKALYMTSGCLMSLSLIAFGVYDYYSRDYDVAELKHWSLVPLMSFVLYVASFSLGFGPIPFVVIPEIVPIRIRSLVLAIACVSCSFFGFVVTKIFGNMRDLMGLPGVYWTYSVFAFLGFVFYWVFIPETKGRTVHDIHRQLSASRSSKASS